jgi:hypothetical protein
MKNKIITSLTHTGFDSGLRRRMSIRGQTLRRFLAMGLSASILGSSLFAQSFTEDPRILSEPMLQLPTEDTVRVVWFTEGPGDLHTLNYGTGLTKTATATSVKMTRMLEDNNSDLSSEKAAELDLETNGIGPANIVERDIWRHEAVATGLTSGDRVPYFVSSTFGTGEAAETFSSREFTLQPIPPEGQPMKIVLTADQQNRTMSPATFQKLEETIGVVDYVFFAGDLVGFPHRASEWFDRDNEGRPAFFPSLQGFFQEQFPDNDYDGGEILQHAPLFGTLGNHETPGRWRPESMSLNGMDGDPQPRWFAEIRYEQKVDSGEIVPSSDPVIAAQEKAEYIRDNSFEFTQYLEMWAHPDSGPRGEEYYFTVIGDVALVSMHVNRVWRNPNSNQRGKLTERNSDLNNPDNWGFGDMFFERYGVGTEQYQWLLGVLASPEFQNAKYKIVLGHQTPFAYGDNAVPVMAEPIAHITYEDGGEEKMLPPFSYPVDRSFWENNIQPLVDGGQITDIFYSYPTENDIFYNDIEPLLEDNGVHLYLCGHSHLWNRTRSGNGVNYLESANYGNTFGVGYEDEYFRQQRAPWARYPGDPRGGFVVGPDPKDYPVVGDPQGRIGAYPTLVNTEKEMDGENRPLPFHSSNNVSAFTVLDTGTGLVESYAFDTRDPSSSVVRFDVFALENSVMSHTIEDTSAESIRVKWESGSADSGTLTVYGDNRGGPFGPASSTATPIGGGLFEHSATVGGLQANQFYTYQINQNDTTVAEEFRTISVLINEVHPQPGGDTNGDGTIDPGDDEFIEFYNNSGYAVDLTGMQLRSRSGILHTFPSGTVVSDQGFLVLFGGGTPTGAFGGAIVQTASSGALNLGDRGGRLMLLDGGERVTAGGYRNRLGAGISLNLNPEGTGFRLRMVDHRNVDGNDADNALSPGSFATSDL